jgi:ATP-binding cassette, subfamily A (ABC1), member 3
MHNTQYTTQMISGVSAVAYWSSTYAFDALSYLVPALLCLGLIYAFHIPAYTAGASAGAAAALLLLYGPAVAPFTYAVSFAFSSHSAAQNAVLLLNFLTGLALMVTSFVLSLLDNTRMINAKLKWVYR